MGGDAWEIVTGQPDALPPELDGASSSLVCRSPPLMKQADYRPTPAAAPAIPPVAREIYIPSRRLPAGQRAELIPLRLLAGSQFSARC